MVKGSHKKSFRNFLNRKCVTYFLIVFFDVLMVIYCACQNKVHYVKFYGNDIFVGETKDMLFGRNNINLFITCFFYIYMIIIKKFFLKDKIDKKFLISTLFFFVFINFMLFYIFTKKIY